MSVDQRTFYDTEELSLHLSDVNVSAMQVSPGSFEGVLTRYHIEGWSFQHIAFNCGTSTCHGDGPTGRAAFLVPLAFDPKTRLLGKHVSDRTIAVYGCSSEHGDVSPPGTRHMVVVLPEHELQLPRTRSSVVEIDPEVACSLRKWLGSLQDTAERNPRSLAGANVKRSIVETLATTFVPAIDISGKRANSGRPELPRLSILRRLREILAVNQGEPIFADDLCKAAGVSVPTLRRIFMEWYGVPPARYLLLRRFYLARAKLRSGQVRTVKEAAEACGFWELSRFSAAYRSLFGELPSQAIVKATGRGK